MGMSCRAINQSSLSLCQHKTDASLALMTIQTLLRLRKAGWKRGAVQAWCWAHIIWFSSSHGAGIYQQLPRPPGPTEAPRRLQSSFRASRRASVRYSPTNCPSVLSLQLSQFPGSRMIARINVTFFTCVAGAISAAPPCNWCAPASPVSIAGGFLLPWSWCAGVGGQQRAQANRSVTSFSQNWACAQYHVWEWHFSWRCESSMDKILHTVLNNDVRQVRSSPRKTILAEVSQGIK